jgi:uncharacterized protein YndB with AHSA1/START domain
MSAIKELDYGELTTDGTHAVVTYHRRFDHPPERVWRALTEDQHLEAWFPTTIEGERTPGAPLTFNHRGVDLPAMHGEMRAFKPPKLLELTWGGDVIRFELQADGDGTALTLTATMKELGKAARDGAGWHVCLGNLALSLDGRQPPRDSGWREINARYQERFGPEASTLGPPKEWEDANPDA